MLISFSGGKDSQATINFVLADSKYKGMKKELVFCDTGWEHEVTYSHIKNIADQVRLPLITLKSKKYNGFLDMVIKKTRFPSRKQQFCTEELKIKPMIDYILSHKEHLIIAQGIRAEESAQRRQMDKECSYFKYYFEPYNDKGKKFSYRGKEVRKWCKDYQSDVIRPIIQWTSEEVVQSIVQSGQRLNPLYYAGMKRVGCFPCINCSTTEIISGMKYDEKFAEKLISAEKIVGRTFFAPGRIPDRFCSREDKNGKKFPTAEDVFKYIRDKKNMDNEVLFDEPVGKCVSHYKICE